MDFFEKSREHIRQFFLKFMNSSGYSLYISSDVTLAVIVCNFTAGL